MHKNRHYASISRSLISAVIIFNVLSSLFGPSTAPIRAAINFPNAQKAQITTTSNSDGLLQVAISGDTIAAGSSNQVEVYIRNGSSWVRQATLRPGNTTTAAFKDINSAGTNDAESFGSYEFALDGDTILMPAYNRGVSIFTRSGTDWTEQPEIPIPADRRTYDGFGFSVALDGDTAVIGVPMLSEGGLVYVYVRAGNAWTLQARLKSTGLTQEHFGVRVAISGDTVLAGTDNSWPNTNAYVFVRNGTAWSQQAILSSPVGGYDTTAVAISGDTALVGWHYADNYLGKAYIWTRTGDTWTIQSELIPDERGINNFYGISVALDGDIAAVGSRRHLADIGDIRVFTRSGATWTQQARLIPDNYLPTISGRNSPIALKIALSGTTLISGINTTNQYLGSVYVFEPGTPKIYPRSYVGVYRPATGAFYLRDSNRWDQGSASPPIVYGDSSYLPVTGDWDGDGIDTIGVYSKTTGVFHLRDKNTAGVPDHLVVFGNPGDQPLSGRWDNTMSSDGVGVFRTSAGIAFLRRGVTNGPADYGVLLGLPGDIGVSGDWDGDGIDSVGYYGYRNPGRYPWVFFLSNSPGSQYADYELSLTDAGTGIPFAGDFGAIGRTGVGIYSDSGWMYLGNLVQTNLISYRDTKFLFGNPGDIPISGHWFAGNSPIFGRQERPALQSLLVVPGSTRIAAPVAQPTLAYGVGTTPGMD